MRRDRTVLLSVESPDYNKGQAEELLNQLSKQSSRLQQQRKLSLDLLNREPLLQLRQDRRTAESAKQTAALSQLSREWPEGTTKQDRRTSESIEQREPRLQQRQDRRTVDSHISILFTASQLCRSCTHKNTLY